MRVLFICHRLPFPPRRGGKIRPFNIIRHFAEAGHSVTVASLARSAEEAEEGEGLQRYCAERIVERITGVQALRGMLSRLPTRSPSSFGYFYSPALHRRVARLLAERSFDLIMVHCSSVASYVADVGGIPKVLDFGDMDSQKWLLYARYRGFPLSAGYWLEGNKLERTEKALARRFDLCTCTTLAELETLRGFDAAEASGWFPNGVDPDYFEPQNEAYDPDSICFVGRMDYYPNQQAVLGFCRDVLPLIRERRPTARLYVVGAAPSRPIRALDGSAGVTVTGTVPDVRPYVRKAALTVAPLAIARGTQNKILESMAMGVPVVASAAAARGVDAAPGRDIVVAESPLDWASAVVEIMANRGGRRRLAEAGRACVLARHSWEASMQRLDGLLERWMSRPEGNRRERANA